MILWTCVGFSTLADALALDAVACVVFCWLVLGWDVLLESRILSAPDTKLSVAEVEDSLGMSDLASCVLALETSGCNNINPDKSQKKAASFVSLPLLNVIDYISEFYILSFFSFYLNHEKIKMICVNPHTITFWPLLKWPSITTKGIVSWQMVWYLKNEISVF